MVPQPTVQQATATTDSRHVANDESRMVWPSMARGARHKCPKCGVGKLFDRYLHVVDVCPACSEELFHHRADDAPAYVTMMIVGHVVVGLMLAIEKSWHPPIALHLIVELPLAVAMSLFLLPSIKGAIVGLQWAAHMHGFSKTRIATR